MPRDANLKFGFSKSLDQAFPVWDSFDHQLPGINSGDVTICVEGFPINLFHVR